MPAAGRPVSPETLRAWRLRLDLTQVEAAVMLRTPYESYRRWEEGKPCAAPGLLSVATACLERHLGAMPHRED